MRPAVRTDSAAAGSGTTSGTATRGRPLPQPSLFSAASRAPSTAPPLSHHDILGLVEPFSRNGLKLDLPASDRMARRLVFMPAAPEPGALLATRWQLDLADPAHTELTRSQTHPSGLCAQAVARGATPAELLATVQALPTAQQWQVLAGALVALSHRIDWPRRRASTPSTPSTSPNAPVLTDAHVQVAGCHLHLRVPRVHSMPGELELRPQDAPAAAPGPVLKGAAGAAAASSPAKPAPPADLLAVLGLRWSRLSLVRGAWRGTVQLKRREPARSADALAALLQAVAHLAQTLAEPPARFHQRFLRARWGVTVRRGVPLAVALGLIAAAALVPVLDLGEGSVLRMLIFNSPPLLMVWMFALREFPRIELPPLPRVPAAQAWAALTSDTTPSPHALAETTASETRA